MFTPISYDNLRQEIKTWYNGYSFGENVPKVYNPFSFMNALNQQKFKNFWFQSGAPTFLIDIFKKEYKKYDETKLTLSEDELGIFDIGTIPLVALMFQTGYLTISSYNEERKLYQLDFPNYEVRTSFQKYLLEIFAHNEKINVNKNFDQDLERALISNKAPSINFSSL